MFFVFVTTVRSPPVFTNNHEVCPEARRYTLTSREKLREFAPNFCWKKKNAREGRQRRHAPYASGSAR